MTADLDFSHSYLLFHGLLHHCSEHESENLNNFRKNKKGKSHGKNSPALIAWFTSSKIFHAVRAGFSCSKSKNNGLF